MGQQEGAVAPHYPTNPNHFEFDEGVARVFDDMAVRSLPGYERAYQVIGHLAARSNFPHFTQVFDMGTSTGKGLATIHAAMGLNPYIDYYGVDISTPMLERALAKCPFATMLNHDLTKGLPEELNSGEVGVVVFGWVLQFIESADARERILRDAYASLTKGGFIAVMEKYSIPDQLLDGVMQDSYITMRRQNGYTLDEIKAKNKALATAMWPASPEWTTKVLRDAGADVHILYRELNFGGIIAIKR